MGDIVEFHAISGLAEAKSVKTSAVSRASRARDNSKRADHRSAGMELRWCHFETAPAPTPISSPSSSRVGQSSMIDRNDGKSDISNRIRQIVLEHKSKMSRDPAAMQGQNVLMKARVAISAFKADFLIRVAYARISGGYGTQSDIAKELGMEQPTYHKYETRSYLPHDLVPQFCRLCGISEIWLFNEPVTRRMLKIVEEHRRKRVRMRDVA